MAGDRAPRPRDFPDEEWLPFDQSAPGLLRQLRRHRPVGVALLAFGLVAIAFGLVTLGRTSTKPAAALTAPGSVGPYFGFDPPTAYDLKRHQVVLVNSAGETWLWANQAWRLAKPANSPPMGCCSVAAWDPGAGRILLFGVEPPGDLSQFADTYSWDGTTWIPLQRQAVAPPAGAPSMAYDPGHHQMVLLLSFGTAAGTVQVQTWIRQSGRWLRRSDLDAPALSFSTAVGFDTPSRTLLALSSNFSGPGTETWRWDGSGWHSMATSHRPPSSAHMRLVNEPTAGGLLLLTQAPTAFGQRIVTQTWTWNGQDWIEREPLAQSDVIPYATTAASDGLHGSLWAFEQFPSDAHSARSVAVLKWSGGNWQELAVARVSPPR